MRAPNSPAPIPSTSAITMYVRPNDANPDTLANLADMGVRILPGSSHTLVLIPQPNGS
jgi:hypothetical protein